MFITRPYVNEYNTVEGPTNILPAFAYKGNIAMYNAEGFQLMVSPNAFYHSIALYN